MKHLYFLPIALLSACFTSCKKKELGAPPAMPPAGVTVLVVAARPFLEWEELSARVVATDRVELTPQVSGVVVSIPFQAGQLVKKDDVLFEIDAATYRAKNDMSAAQLARAEAALTQATSESARVPSLLAAQAMTSEEAEMRQSNLFQARAQLAAAQAEHQLTGIDLQRTKVRSPIDGRISRALVTVGNQVSIGTALTSIVSIDPMHVYAELDESTAVRARQALLTKKVKLDEMQRVPLELRIADELNFSHKGWLESLDNRIMPGTGTLSLRAAFANGDEALMDGMFAKIRIPLSVEKPTVLIPDTACKTDQGKKFVYVVDEKSTAQYRSVVLGPITPEGRVIREGLKDGDKVIINGLAKIFMPGMPVNPQPEAP
jgi:RND family efflux transporter MFP subunit